MFIYVFVNLKIFREFIIDLEIGWFIDIDKIIYWMFIMINLFCVNYEMEILIEY